jgi:predicted LPLAT superfamily acyltransferase
MKHTDVEAHAVNEAAQARVGTGQGAPKGERSDKAESGDWARAPERSNMLALRFIVFMALVCGRHVTRLLLPPIALYFLLFAPTQRRHIKRYLFRAIGPHAGWTDGFRLLHAFASTVLDRVYFLRGRMDLFELSVQGNVPLEAEALAGRGAFMLGAHVGSFEVLGACKQQTLQPHPHHLRLAMLMFPDNAQRITAILNAIALPELRPHVIALGRPHSMLALRDWLDGGGLGGMLADRTLPGSEDQPASQRGNSIVLPFLGQPAAFNDGPFRLAALLRRKVFFMAGLYRGGARYDIQFDLLADFGERVTDPAERERRIRAAVEAYVARLETICRAYPYNWFNFHDFWLEDAA